jgi:hypothetical protein
MQIISHRGYWMSSIEKNKMNSFERSFNLGFGTETDIRDFNGKLVISHDIPNPSIEELLYLDDFLKLYKSIGNNLPLALNIKSDGLQEKLDHLLNKFSIDNYFVFDMSIPDHIGYLKMNIPTFTRQSEHEKFPVFYEESKGVWLDAFHSIWYDHNTIKDHVGNNKHVAIVSFDLHKIEYLSQWEYLKFKQIHLIENVILCTDYPEKAKLFFYEQ